MEIKTNSWCYVIGIKIPFGITCYSHIGFFCLLLNATFTGFDLTLRFQCDFQACSRYELLLLSTPSDSDWLSIFLSLFSWTKRFWKRFQQYCSSVVISLWLLWASLFTQNYFIQWLLKLYIGRILDVSRLRESDTILTISF